MLNILVLFFVGEAFKIQCYRLKFVLTLVPAGVQRVPGRLLPPFCLLLWAPALKAG